MSEKGLNVVVLGATGGVGSEVARRLAGQGAQLVLAARDVDRLDELDVPGERFRIEATEPDTLESCLQQAHERLGRVDGVVNCLGTLLLKPAHLTTDEEWNHTLQVNLTSCLAVLRGAAKVMKEGGSLVFVSSAAARIGLANHEAIAAAKAGVIGLTLAAAASYGHRGIRVNAVAPGLTRSRMTEKIFASEKSLDRSTGMHVLGRAGEPGDVASAIVWLLDQSWVTGQIIGVDGGLGTVRSRG